MKLRVALTPREEQILLMRLDGSRNSDVAAALNLSEGYVKHRARTAFRLLKVHSLAEARVAMENPAVRSAAFRPTTVPAAEYISPRLRFAVLSRDAFTCQYCGRKAPEVPLQVDHIVPVALGGAFTEDNLRTACAECNVGKSDTPLGA